MSKVFVSYRRSDTQMAAGRLRESLSARLGHEAVFRDKDNIAGGDDWIRAIDQNLKEDAIVLALIGPNWLAAKNEAGARRLDDPGDWNRIELESALRLNRIVVPVLIDDAEMPTPAQLPESLKTLARMNAIKLRDDDWDSDIERLVGLLSAHGVEVKDRARTSAVPQGSRRMVVVGTAAALIAVLAGGTWLYKSSEAATKMLSGSWAMTHFNEDQSKHAGMLTLEQNGQKLTGRVVWAPRNVTREISSGLISGSTVEFEAVGPRGAKRVYRGELDSVGNTIQGLAQGGSSTRATWSAVRQNSTRRRN